MLLTFKISLNILITIFIFKLLLLKDECLKEMLALKDRNRRTQRVATYVRSTVSLANSSTSVNSQTSTAQQLYESLDAEQFQSKYEIKNLQNK